MQCSSGERYWELSRRKCASMKPVQLQFQPLPWARTRAPCSSSTGRNSSTRSLSLSRHTRKIITRLTDFISATLLLRNFEIQSRASLGFSGFLPSRQRLPPHAQTYFGQHPWLTGTSGEAGTWRKRHICNTEAICSSCCRHEIAPVCFWHRKELGLRTFASTLLEI